MRILFIGNSHTFLNDMPFQVREMIHLRKGTDACEVWSVTVGGKPLSWHGDEAGTIQALRQFAWDHVVLQQVTHPFGGYEELAEGFGKLKPHIEKAGAEVTFYMTWKQKNAPEEEQEWVDAAFMKLIERHSLRMAPVSKAWTQIRKRHPEMELYDPDESHASPAGSYLAACVFFATFTGDSPVGLPARIVGRGDVLVDLDETTASALQRAAEEACGVKAGG
jgi:hypothetical protein